jgi:hypothetical protein
MTRTAEKSENEEGLVFCCSSTRPGTDIGVVAMMGASAAVIFLESTSICSFLAAIRPSLMLIRLKVSLMALKLASVVGVTTSIAWALSDQMGKKLWRLFLWIFLVENPYL